MTQHWPADAPDFRHVLAARHAPATPDDHWSATTLIVGESNPYGSSPDFALYTSPPHSAGGRLFGILGIEEREQLACWRSNLCYGPWDNAEAFPRMRKLFADDVPWSNVILLGAKVRKIYRELHLEESMLNSGQDCQLLHAGEYGKFRVLTMPHPSGRCRLWNVPGVEAAVKRLFRDMLDGGRE